MAKPSEKALDDVSSAPESGTVRDETSGNQPSARNNDPRQTSGRPGGARAQRVHQGDDPSIASEEP